MQSIVTVLALGLAMLALEQARPARRFARVAGWWPRAIGLTAVQGAVALVAINTCDRWLPALALWRLDTGSVAGDALAGYLVLTFVYYWWHRARHEVPFLWRWLHRVHHSATRIELITSFYKHPAEIACNALLSALVVYVLLGLAPEAAAVVVTVSGMAELFYHWNVKTPRWLGFIVQRPESHCVHHERGRHTGNFADLPLWDLLFGTFDNPHRAPRHCGFGPEIEQRFPQLLMGRIR
ncbi:MAG TPA: sterol desaturase family protein [Burkholderiales bacterium]|nr:sterol desaturase family protein [Burkholderiales bacterium]